MKNKNLKNMILFLYRVLLSHVNSNGDSHLPATIEKNGFMTAEHVNKNLSSSGELEVLKEGEDVLSLPPGNYYGNKLKNTPDGDDSFHVIRITDIRDRYGRYPKEGRKKVIRITNLYQGKDYTMHFYAGKSTGYAITGWRQVTGTKTVWEGEEKETGKVLKLSDDIRLFDYLEITLGNGITQKLERKGNVFTLHTNVMGSDQTMMYFNSVRLKKPEANDSLQIEFNRQISFNTEKLTSAKQNDQAAIIKIVGVK